MIDRAELIARLSRTITDLVAIRDALPEEAPASAADDEQDMLRAALVALCNRDEERDCYFCDKRKWGAKFHGEKCPFHLAYVMLGALPPDSKEPEP